MQGVLNRTMVSLIPSAAPLIATNYINLTAGYGLDTLIDHITWGLSSGTQPPTYPVGINRISFIKLFIARGVRLPDPNIAIFSLVNPQAPLTGDFVYIKDFPLGAFEDVFLTENAQDPFTSVEVDFTVPLQLNAGEDYLLATACLWSGTIPPIWESVTVKARQIDQRNNPYVQSFPLR